MADKVHCIRKTLRLMPEEAKMLAKKACDNGMNEAEYIRLLISQKPNDYPEALQNFIHLHTPDIVIVNPTFGGWFDAAQLCAGCG